MICEISVLKFKFMYKFLRFFLAYYKLLFYICEVAISGGHPIKIAAIGMWLLAMPHFNQVVRDSFLLDIASTGTYSAEWIATHGRVPTDFNLNFLGKTSF